jgi:hypothetical protein
MGRAGLVWSPLGRPWSGHELVSAGHGLVWCGYSLAIVLAGQAWSGQGLGLAGHGLGWNGLGLNMCSAGLAMAWTWTLLDWPLDGQEPRTRLSMGWAVLAMCLPWAGLIRVLYGLVWLSSGHGLAMGLEDLAMNWSRAGPAGFGLGSDCHELCKDGAAKATSWSGPAKF